MWAIKKGIRPQPFVAIWSRGGAKSSSAELAASVTGMRGLRKYIVYLSATQDQADKHVATIAGQLESAGVERALNQYGSSKGWRRNRLRAAEGFTIDALGLDTGARGIKIDDTRPDFIILDDIDDRHDTPETTQKKIETLTDTVLSAGSIDCAVLGAQNLIHANSIFARLADGRADFLSDRIVSGPHPAIKNLTYEVRSGDVVITGGEPTWEGQDLVACQGLIKTAGPSSFFRENQHEVAETVGALWTRELIEALRVTTVPQLRRIGVGVDPEATSTEGSAETGIIAAGLGPCYCKGYWEEHAFVLEDASQRATPNGWAKGAVTCYNKYQSDVLVAEDNNGGEMVEYTISTIPGAPPVKRIHASRNKQARAEPIASLYSEHKVHHLGMFPELEKQQVTWVPGKGKSPDRIDAAVWILTELMLGDEVQELEEGINPFGEWRG